MVTILVAASLAVASLATVAVRSGSSFEPVDAQILVKTCSTLPNGAPQGNADALRECYVDYFANAIKAKGTRYAVDQLESYQKVTRGLDAQCHDVGHLLGRWAWKQLGMKSMDADATVCGFSYGHGIMQEASEELTPDEMLENFMGLCNDTPQVLSCTHGFGHTLADIKYTPAETERICAKQALGVDRDIIDRVGASIDGVNFTCMEGWVMESKTLDPEPWKKMTGPEDPKNGPLKALATCEGMDEGPGRDTCRSATLRNWVKGVDTKIPNFIDLEEKRLNWFRDFCYDLEGIRQGTCLQHLGLTTAEVWDPYSSNEVAGKKFGEYCNGEYMRYCLQAALSSRWERLGQSYDNVVSACNAIEPGKKEQCLEYLADVARPRK